MSTSTNHSSRSSDWFSGAEFKAFWNAPDSIPKNQYIDDDLYRIDGREVSGSTLDVQSVSDSARVEIVCGWVFNRKDSKESSELAPVIRKWIKAQSTVSLTFDVPAEHQEAIKARIQATIDAYVSDREAEQEPPKRGSSAPRL
jgi:hypothetical protein